MKTYTKPALTKKQSMELTHRERQLIARLRQLRNLGERRAVVELDAEAGPRVIDRSPAM